MALSAAERVRVRYHLGFLNVQLAASISFGIPRPIQTLFLVETAMSNIIEDAVGIVRDLLARLDETENMMFEAQTRLAASQLGELKLREDEITALEASYVMWADRLADTLGVPKYPYSSKFRRAGAAMAGSIPVSG